MKFYLKILFFYFLFQNVRLDSVLSENGTNSTNSSSLYFGLLENNPSSNLTNNSSTPVLLNCTNGINNYTDLSQCTPINITLSYQCTKVSYDFDIFSLAWQPRYCIANSRDCNYRTNEQPRWRIQGIRGSFFNKTWVAQCCSDKELKITELNPILTELESNWEFDKDSKPKEKIIEEWNLHGSCVQENEQKTSLQLYSKSLDLFKSLPIEQWLSHAKIEPSNDKKYGLQFFNYSISSKINKRYQMRCKTLDYDKRISIIDSINFCVDKFNSELIDCPIDFESNCLEMVYYPSNLLEAQTKIPEEVFYRDMNYYRYHNYHNSYSGMYPYGRSGSNFGTGLALGATGAAATLALPAAYYYFKNQNKMNKNKYNNFGGYPGSHGSMPWYSSTAFSNSFAAPSPNYYNNKNSGSFGGNYPRQPNYYPPTIFSGVQNNKNFGNLNVPDLSPSFYNANRGPSYSSSYPNSYPSYSNSHPSNSYPPKYSSSISGSNVPSYPAYNNNPSFNPPPSYSSMDKMKSGSNVPSYPAYNSAANAPSYPAYNSAPNAPPPYSKIDKNSPYPKQAYDPPPSYSSIDKQKNGIYPKLDSSSNKHSPSAPSLSEINKPSYPAYPSNKQSSSGSSSSSSSSSSKPKSSGGWFGSLFGSNKKSSSSSSSSSSNNRRGSSGGGSRSRGGGFGRSRG